MEEENLMKHIADVSKALPARAQDGEDKILQVPVLGFWGLGEIAVGIYYEVAQAVNNCAGDKTA